jgi:ubiquinone/menaquinone biosynthesis C-methylase UbiE
MAGPLTRPGETAPKLAATAPRAKDIRRAYLDVFEQDNANIASGLYRTATDLNLKKSATLLATSMRFLADIPRIDERRLRNAGTEVRALPGSEKFPAYYRQNFHWQTDGWLTRESAQLYDFQVEALFAGTAAAMRRTTALALLADSLQGHDQRKTSVLDLGCGTGNFAAEIMGNYPRLKLTALDMSPAYADEARSKLCAWRSAEVCTGAAEVLPFPDASFDCVVSVYLFHELPPKVRHAAFAEVARVLKPSGTFILADALQTGDNHDLDAMLEYFPIGFHEPFFSSWLNTDLSALGQKFGFEVRASRQALLTKAIAFKRSPSS